MNISDKVVCVDDRSREPGKPLWRPDYPRPKQGCVYVIRAVWADEESAEGWLIQLVGFPDLFRPSTNQPMGFTPSRFRKLEEVQAENRAAAQAQNP